MRYAQLRHAIKTMAIRKITGVTAAIKEGRYVPAAYQPVGPKSTPPSTWKVKLMNTHRITSSRPVHVEKDNLPSRFALLLAENVEVIDTFVTENFKPGEGLFITVHDLEGRNVHLWKLTRDAKPVKDN